MNIRFHLCVIAVLFISRCQCIKIRKCCKLGQQLNSSTMCIDSSENETDDWIPRDSFIIHSSKSTVKISSERVLKTIKEIYTGRVEVGFPGCDRSWRDLALAWKDPEIKDQFYLIYDTDKTVKLNLNRESVYHTNVTLSFSKEFPPNTYCIDKGPHESYVVVICPCSEITCIRKCCHQNVVFDEDNNECVHLDSLNLTDQQYDAYKDWRPQFEASDFDDEENPDEVEYFLLAGKLPPCFADREVFTDRPTGEKPLLFLPDGELRLNISDGSTAPPGDHCGEFGWSNATRRLSPLLLRCFSAKSVTTHKDAKTRASSYVVLLAASAVPLFCAAFCIAFGGDLEERRGARPALAHVSCLAVAHVAAAIAQSPVGVNGLWCVLFVSYYCCHKLSNA